MLRYTVRRLFWMFPVLFGIGTITFLLMHVVPGGPWDENKKLPQQVTANLNHRYGIDDPIWIQYGKFLGNAVRALRNRSWTSPVTPATSSTVWLAWPPPSWTKRPESVFGAKPMQ